MLKTKGERTREAILDTAARLATEEGLSPLSIGRLAEATDMSKSGLFAHFGSKLDLQLAALDEAARQFAEGVFLPALKAPRGLKRMRALFENWISWPQRARLPGGCPIDAASREYLHQPGPMRDAIVARQKQLDRELAKCVQMAIDEGELASDSEAEQLAYDMIGIVLAFYRTELLLGTLEASRRARAAFDRVVEQHSPRK